MSNVDVTPPKRKPGQPEALPTKLVRQLSKDLGLSGRSPLHVMIRNMLFWDESATMLGEQLKGKLSDIEGQDAKELGDLLKRFMEAQANAQKCAVDAAPYCHPKLQSIAIKKEAGGKKAPLTMTLPHPQGEDRSYRAVGESVQPADIIINEMTTGEDGVTDRNSGQDADAA